MCFFFNDTATTEIYTLSLHDALPICGVGVVQVVVAQLLALDLARGRHAGATLGGGVERRPLDRKSTRLNSSHANISYAVFCLKKKKNNRISLTTTNIHHVLPHLCCLI